MKKALALAVVLSVVSIAGAGVDLFLTKGPTTGDVPGMKEPDTFATAEKNFLSNYVKWSGTPTRSPFFQTAGTTQTYFLWAEISLPEGWFAQIYGLELKGGTGAKGKATLVDGLMYRHNKTGSGAYKRWDGAAKIPIPGLAAAVTARGIEAAANPSDIANDDGGKTYALIGAVSVEMAANATDPNADLFALGLGPATMAIRVTDADGNTTDYTGDQKSNWYPDLTIQGIPAYDPNGGNTHPAFPAVRAIPEPASVVLLCLGALLRRR